ncbi:M23 family metallopeptidase [Siansivirga zeaxanthinifaciens]|uniref:Peptidase M23 n=1 Tax=Siansivirga zeaxanthinifaciens CC-SAMT-1 TaxID=1454006 RepID=A0A0C5WCD0_9FLAO|nr:M23 family metallopeptidase [Siansivirga zeaxanthinifaciens]AJR03977.1 peptidase M23 [Siansivirga zeaxanthinifaciens CC-SAMT-1]
MRLSLIFVLIFTSLINGQNNYPQDYFTSPLEIPLILSGTFAELRSNHFHSGLDIKTQGRQGLKVLSVADGFISRIKIAHFGYGKALYITHPNGYTSVYGHLQSFSPEIEAYIKAQQYKAESFEIELFPTAETLPVTKGQHVAYSGNTGGSGGPHLHFEIRNKEEHPLNPMLFGIDIKDTTKPYVRSIYVYPLGENAGVNNSNKKQALRLIPLSNGDYTTENIEAFGKIGFGIETNDRLDMASNSNGVHNIETSINGTKNFEIDFKEFSFDETLFINQLIDYNHFNNTKRRIQKLFRVNNPLSLYKNPVNDGFLNIADSTSSVYKIHVSDFKKNVTTVLINIKGTKSASVKTDPKKTTPYLISANQKTTLKAENVTVNFAPDTFYEDFYIDFEVSNDTLKLHEDVIPTKKPFEINFDINPYKGEDRDKLFIAKLIGRKNYPVYCTTTKKDHNLSTSTKVLGTYTLATDTKSPTIYAPNFNDGQWISNYRYLTVKIADDLSGISSYRATINGQWILMEYDYKTKTLTYDFNDHNITDTKNILKLIVTDNVGNSSTFESVFYRK